MKYIKKFEFNINDIGKNEHIYADFSPRMGALLIIKNNDLCYFYFHEAYRLILNYLEDNIIKSTSPLNLMNLIYNYITSQVSTLTKSQILNKSSISNKKINSSDKLILNTIKKN